MTKRIVLYVVLVVGIVVAAIYLTTPRGWTGEDPGRVDTWETSPMPRSTPTSGLVRDRARNHKVNSWKTQVRSRQQLRVSRGSCGYKTRAHVVLFGGNEMIRDVVTAHMTITWCGWGDRITSDVTVNTWGDGRLLWDYQGVIDRVRGHGVNSHGVEYAYRRYYFKWTRGLPQAGVTQSTVAWISMTVRGDLSCVADKYSVNGTVIC